MQLPLQLPFPLSPYRREILRLWLPALLAGGLVWLVFVLIGHTPPVRAAGLALAIIGVALGLRWMGSLLAVTGALALAFSPAFWLQTGGGGTLPATLVVALSIAAVIGTLAVSLSRRPYVAVAVALLVFGVIFASQIGTARSLRFTILASTWLIFLLTRALLLTNPRPDGPPPARLNAQYRAGILLILTLGVINDPLFVLFLPAVALALGQTRARIPWWYWMIIGGLLLPGIWGMIDQYYDPRWWVMTAERAAGPGTRDVPYLIAAGWRDSARWLDLFDFVVSQFTLVGLLLSVLGLARLSRWYPTLGVTTLVAYAAFFAFGLAYYGADRPILLLPMLTLQVMWITYAVHTFSDWLEKSVAPANRTTVRRLAQVVYVLLPVLLLWNIAGGVQ